MKTLSVFIISFCIALTALAQSNIIVTVKLNGNLNREIVIDGTSYTPSDYSNTSSTNKNMITVNNLLPGQHTLQVVRTTANNTRRNVGTERVFNLRAGYDLDITVNGNGTVQLSEKRIGNRGPGNTNTGNAMNASNFNMLVRDITRITTNSGRVNALNTAFANTTNYFTSTQISQLVRLTNGEANRIQLLKASYRSVTDPANFNNLYTLIASRAGRNDVAAYVATYAGNTTGTYEVAMTNANFNKLLTSVRNEYSTEARLNSIFAAFNNTSNYFTTNQAIRLIQLITGEANMVHLAKASFRSITDKYNFESVYKIIPTQAGRNDLANYVSSYNPNVVYNGTVTGSTPVVVKTPMTATEFNTLHTEISRQWLPGAKKAAVINAFNSGNHFTTAQASQLIQLDNDEDDRLDMAKAGYKTLVDPVNFIHIINLFNNSTYRAELTAYAQNYTIPGATTGNNTTYRTPINEAEFNSLLSSIRSQWLPGAKKAAVINAFTNSGNYFTAVQASQLVQLDSDEDDRLDMAKASYKVVVDPANFNVVYNLFTNQSYKDQLAVYVNANK